MKLKLKKLILEVLAQNKKEDMWQRSIAEKVMNTPEIQSAVEMLEALTSIIDKNIAEDLKEKCFDKVYNALDRLFKNKLVTKIEDGHGNMNFRITRSGISEWRRIFKKKNK